MSAGRLLATLTAVALTVFCATAHFYRDQSPAVAVLPEVTESSSWVSRMVPMDIIDVGRHSPNQTSRTVMVKSGSNKKSLIPTRQNRHSEAVHTTRGGLKVSNVASEVGFVIALQAIFPVLNRIILVAKRVKWASIGVRVSPTIGRVLRTLGDIWHTLMLYYKKTALSKIVTRAKKMVKIFQHHDDEHDEDEHDRHGKHGHAKHSHHGNHKRH